MATMPDFKALAANALAEERRDIEHQAIADLVSRMAPSMEGIIKRQLRRGLVNCLAQVSQQKQIVEEVEQYAEQVVAKGEDWGAW